MSNIIITINIVIVIVAIVIIRKKYKVINRDMESLSKAISNCYLKIELLKEEIEVLRKKYAFLKNNVEEKVDSTIFEKKSEEFLNSEYDIKKDVSDKIFENTKPFLNEQQELKNVDTILKEPILKESIGLGEDKDAFIDTKKTEDPVWSKEQKFDFDKILNFEYWVSKLGIILLLFGIFLLYRYSLEKGWITNSLKVFFGVLIGIFLEFAAYRAYKNKRLNFGQIFAGGGIAVFYISIFSAWTIYKIIPSYILAFGIMLGITSFAFSVSLKQNQVILSLIGFLGGILTPFMLYTGQNNIMGLLLYCSFLVVAVTVIYFYKGWRALFLISLFCSMTIALICSFQSFLSYGDKICIQTYAVFIWLLFSGFFVLRAVFEVTHNFKKESLDFLNEYVSLKFRFFIDNVMYLVIFVIPVFLIGFSLFIWEDYRNYAVAFLSLFLAVLYGFLGYFLNKKYSMNKFMYINQSVAFVLFTLSMSIFVKAEFFILAVVSEALFLTILYNKTKDTIISKIADGILFICGVWLVVRMFKGNYNYLNSKAITEIMVIALALAASECSVKSTFFRTFFGHIAIIIFLYSLFENKISYFILSIALATLIFSIYSKFIKKNISIFTNPVFIFVFCVALYIKYRFREIELLILFILFFCMIPFTKNIMMKRLYLFGGLILSNKFLFIFLNMLDCSNGTKIVVFAIEAFALIIFSNYYRKFINNISFDLFCIRYFSYSIFIVILYNYLNMTLRGRNNYALYAEIIVIFLLALTKLFAMVNTYGMRIYRIENALLGFSPFFALGVLVFREINDISVVSIVLSFEIAAFYFVSLMERIKSNGLLSDIKNNLGIYISKLAFWIMCIYTAFVTFFKSQTGDIVFFNTNTFSNLLVLGMALWLIIRGKISNIEKRIYIIFFNVILLFLIRRELLVLNSGEAYITLCWGAYSIFIVILGLRKALTALVNMGILIMLVTVGKLFIIDLKELENIWRVLLFLTFGTVLMVVSYYMQKLWKGKKR